MRRSTLCAAALLVLSLPAHSAPTGLNLQALHLDGLIADVALPLAGNLLVGLDGLPALTVLQGGGDVLPGLVSDVALPLAGTLLGNDLPALPGLGGLDGLLPVVVSDVALPLVGGLVSGAH